MPRLLFTRERPGTHCTGDWVGPRASLDRWKNLAPTGIWSPDHPARSQSLYRLNYPAHLRVGEALQRKSIACKECCLKKGHYTKRYRMPHTQDNVSSLITFHTLLVNTTWLIHFQLYTFHLAPYSSQREMSIFQTNSLQLCTPHYTCSFIYGKYNKHLDAPGNRSETPGKFWNVVLEKDGEDQLDQSCEKWRSVT